MSLLQNMPLWSALIAIIVAQVIKVPIRAITEKQVQPDLAFSTGGMPSSHSAAVAALTTSIGFETGLDSPVFAASFVFSIIIMFDASGVRRAAGEQAILLNLLLKDFQRFVDEAKNWGSKQEFEKNREIREMLGHQPIEVFFGALTGIAISLIIYLLF
ncbi:divergent PAP2 family protein [Terribacillus sp. DMT04]|uniref:divergent PAP2 family protein n=1 Tax=Terribacillus sp. DMT04 TaxID=2850441 RepID=UPI001C2C5C8E|nr:divergent PAP2 family protein [Terribacillus sp. DMT04]QXE00785.1 divergent PAP2 family protein [Terribacillus sp. DMT04]